MDVFAIPVYETYCELVLVVKYPNAILVIENVYGIFLLSDHGQSFLDVNNIKVKRKQKVYFDRL